MSQTPATYLSELERAVSEDRQAHDKPPLKPSRKAAATREIKTSTTDPQSGYMTREGKPQSFFYLDHRTVDAQHALITDTFVTAGNVHDSRPYLARMDRQCVTFDFVPRAVGLDAGYKTPAICLGLEQRSIYGVIGYRRPARQEGYLAKWHFTYDADSDQYRCPHDQVIPYRTTTREGYRQYHSDPTQCQHCPLLSSCTNSRNHTKVITRHVWQDSVERVDQHRLSPSGKRLYQRRKETVERSFADAKQLHGHRYARYRGLRKVSGQCLLAAACQNMKKIALILARFLRFLREQTSGNNARWPPVSSPV